MAKMVSHLNFYFTNPTLDDPLCWHQCCQCLKISGELFTEDHIHSLFLSCGQQVEAMRTSVLNETNHQTHVKAMEWMNNQWNRVQDQAVLTILNQDAPNLVADPCLQQKVTELATKLKDKVDAKAYAKAQHNA